MVQNSNDLPEGTDTIIAGASITTDPTGGGDDSDVTLTVASIDAGDALIVDSPTTGATAAAGATGTTGSSGSSGSLAEMFRGGSERLSGSAGGKARELVGQGLERGSEALANVSRLIGDTATGLDERLGEEFGDYARRAATSIEDVANRLASKDPDALFDDTRDFVRKSPGVALAGAAIVGFAIARLIKNGLAPSDDETDGQPTRTTSAD